MKYTIILCLLLSGCATNERADIKQFLQALEKAQIKPLNIRKMKRNK